MRVLIADAFEESGVAGLRDAGCEVELAPELEGDALVAAIGERAPDVLVVRSTKVTEAALTAGHLQLVVRAGAGVNTIDVDAASRRGIYVANCPGKNSVAVAELAFGLIAAIDRRIPDNVAALREGRWRKSEFSKARGLYGRTLGLVGLGSIGLEVAARARAFGMPVIAWSRSLTDERAAELGVRRVADLLQLAREADVVSVHVALTPETRGLIGEEFLQAMRPGAYFVNTARGEVVDEAALARAIEERQLRVGLDVWAQEPAGGSGEFADPLGGSPAVYGTHHIGASTQQAQEAIAAETVRIVRTFAETGSAPNVVNLAVRSPAVCSLVVRHLDQPGILAGILDVISTLEINVQEMTNVIFEGGEAAVAHINLDEPPPAEVLAGLTSDPRILNVQLVKL